MIWLFKEPKRTLKKKKEINKLTEHQFESNWKNCENH